MADVRALFPRGGRPEDALAFLQAELASGKVDGVVVLVHETRPGASATRLEWRLFGEVRRFELVYACESLKQSLVAQGGGGL